MLYDVAKGLLYLHRRRIVHLDLKSGERRQEEWCGVEFVHGGLA